MRRTAIVLAIVAMVLAIIPAATAAPKGNENKDVIPIDFDIPDFAECDGGAMLDLSVSGWVQFRDFKGEGNKHLDMGVFHVIATFTNGDASFRWVDVGPDMAYIDKDGNLIVTITGRPADVAGEGFSLNGHAVLENGVLVHVSGNVRPTDTDQACEAIG